ncbi:hypothetical protein M422DRAFT_82961, partial [Sphaerobolus stellatus SS14]
VLVCLDGNFTQKCLRGKYDDPTLKHPQSHFLPEEDLRKMEEQVENTRKLKPNGSKVFTKLFLGMLPDEVLDECEKVFIAAQEKMAKASSLLYADTVLMAMLC